MIIKQIKIEKLHGSYNYSIDFFDDLTFLYGTNGCGKTTILNILTSIVTGKLYYLVDYLFDDVYLVYVDEKEVEHTISLEIVINKSIRNMRVTIEDKLFEIEDIDRLKERIYRKAIEDEEGGDTAFFSVYPMAKVLKDTFNYIYLPLSRFGNEMYLDRDYYRYRRQFMQPMINSYKTYLNSSLQYIEDLIKNSCLNINVQENKINDSFRKDVVSASMSVSVINQLRQVIREIDDCVWDDVLKSKDIYVEKLRDIDMYDDRLKSKLDQFIDEFKKAYDNYQKEKTENNPKIRFDFAWQYAEFKKIQSVVELAKETEKRKTLVRKPKDTFLNVINGFFESSGTNKRIGISSDGQVEIYTNNGKIRLSELSSGEKQIIITFASLIFGLKGKGTGVYIIDEPESSLHIEWQQRFVPSILQLDKKFQLIFATHSPEIIGKYRDKAVNLVKG